MTYRLLGKTEEEHKSFKQCLQRLSAAGITLNKGQCKCNQKDIEFLGHVIGQQSIKALAEMVKTVKKIEERTALRSLRKFLGVVNQMGNSYLISHMRLND